MSLLKSSLNRHLLDAYYNWFHENGFSKIHIQCYIDYLNCPELQPYSRDGLVLLNLAPQAVKNFRYTDTGLSVGMSLKGVPVQVEIPFYALYSIEIPCSEEGAMVTDFPCLEMVIHQMETGDGEVEMMASNDELDGDMFMTDQNYPPGSFAVFAPPKEATESTVPSPTVAKEEPAPLLDFGHYGGSKIPLLQQPGSRYKGKPSLKVIQGGKQD